MIGCLEAIIVPSISLIIAGFYKKSEQPPRNALVFAAASSIINGFLSWAVGHIPSTAPLSISQYLFLITGMSALGKSAHGLSDLIYRLRFGTVVHSSLHPPPRLSHECFFPYRKRKVPCCPTPGREQDWNHKPAMEMASGYGSGH